ncbi:hypothetical protein [uncultured Nostoc sp.]|uniref:hypothetical protein n=1 Tax=uncultured Nostoc sp. TaxID=340711 RepID=UPI0035C97029
MQIKLSTLQRGFQIVATLFADLEELFQGEIQAPPSTATPPVETPVSTTSPSA